jgi:uncharacterized protein
VHFTPASCEIAVSYLVDSFQRTVGAGAAAAAGAGADRPRGRHQRARWSRREAAALEAKLAAGWSRTRARRWWCCWCPTTAPEDIAAYANRVGNTWKIGRRDVGDGLIVLVAVQDRRMRIEVAKTLEGAVPDIAAKHIIDEAMAPRFRQGDYAGGLDAAMDQLGARIRGEALPPVRPAHAGHGPAVNPASACSRLLILLFVFVPVIGAIARGILGRKLGALATGAGVGWLAFAVTASLLLACWPA